ncbi:hypothetical protein [Actinocorallia longicatena]|uniref:DUF4395 domain-containing protein n=1 Tax=Actinocorallia longicatena TaxID=111803 RepID=A0ABP6QEK5_9ACTN
MIGRIVNAGLQPVITDSDINHSLSIAIITAGILACLGFIWGALFIARAIIGRCPDCGDLRHQIEDLRRERDQALADNSRTRWHR